MPFGSHSSLTARMLQHKISLRHLALGLSRSTEVNTELLELYSPSSIKSLALSYGNRGNKIPTFCLASFLTQAQDTLRYLELRLPYANVEWVAQEVGE